MEALYFNGENLIYTKDYKKPSPKENESLIKILYAGICNTDKEILKGYKPEFKGILGHEFVGIVEESNDLDLIGKTVVGEINRGCGNCIYCKTNREKHCINREVIGIENHDGVFAQYLVWENRLLHIVPDELDNKKALFTETLAAAIEILERVHIKPSTKIAILGDGRLSFMIAQVIALTGANLTIIGKHEEKLKNFGKYGKTTTKLDDSYEIVIEATGSPTGFETIVIKSTYASNITTDLSYFVVNEITIIGSRCGPFEPALNLLKNRYVDFPVVEFYKLKDYKEAFNAKAFKIGFEI